MHADVAVQQWQYQEDEDARVLWNALTSRACLWQLLLTSCLCSGFHVLMAWGTLSNWNAHDPIAICLFGWTHPAGYHAPATSISEAMPVDATIVAFVVCLGAMKRIGDVQRGWVAWVPPSALHRGPLWLLFPRGVDVLPRLSSLIGVAVVWGTLWGGLCLVILSIAWWIHGGGSTNLCLPAWSYILGRACWSTTEAVLVSAGSFLLWCSKGHDVTSSSLVERARLRREADDADSRKAAATFGVFQVIAVIIALGVILQACYTWYTGCIGLVGFTPTSPGGVVGVCSTPPDFVWITALVLAVSALVVSVLGLCLSRYHQRDEKHAAKRMRPGVLLFIYTTLLGCTALATGTLGAITQGWVPPAMHYVLENWAWVKTRALPFSAPLQVATSTATNLSRLTIVLIALAAVQILGILNLLMLLSRNGALVLLPFACHFAALALAAITIGAGYVFGPTACLVSQQAYAGTQLLMSGALLLLLLPFARASFSARHAPCRFLLYVLVLVLVTSIFAMSAALNGQAASAAWSDAHWRWETIELLLPVKEFLCTGQREHLFTASAVGVLTIFTALSSAALLLLLLLLLLAAYTRFDPRRIKQRMGRHSAFGSANRTAPPSLDGSAACLPTVVSDAWWWTPRLPLRRGPQHESLLPADEPDTHDPSHANPPVGSGRAHSASMPAATYEGRYDLPAQYDVDRLRGASASGTVVGGGPRPSASGVGFADGVGGAHASLSREDGTSLGTSMRDDTTFSNVDGDGPLQALLNNARLLQDWIFESSPSLSRTSRAILVSIAVVSVLGGIFIGAMAFADSIAAASLAWDPPPPQLRTMRVPFAVDETVSSTRLRIQNSFRHGITKVLISHAPTDEIYIELRVLSTLPLDDSVRLLHNASCSTPGNGSSHPAPWATGGLCTGAPRAELNITAAPPTSCHQECAWSWLWFPCRCEALANLTVVLPAGSSANITRLSEDLKLIRDIVSTSPFNAFGHALVDLEVDTAGSLAVLAPLGGESFDIPAQPTLLNNVAVRASGEIRIKSVLAGGALVAHGGGKARLSDVLSATSVDVFAAAVSASNVFVAQPCIFGHLPAYGWEDWFGGPACAGLDRPLGKKPSIIRPFSGPYAIVLGSMNLTASGEFAGALVLNGTYGLASARVSTRGGVVVLDGARFLGGLDVGITHSDGEANLLNVAALDCSACKALDQIGKLSWEQLLTGSAGDLFEDYDIFCTCPTAYNGTQGVSFVSHSASFVSTFVMARSIAVASHSGGASIADPVMLASAPSINGSVPALGVPTISAASHYGAITLANMIASPAISSDFAVNLWSMDGDVKAVFSDGTVNGSYTVTTMRTEHGQPGIGHVGVVIDNEITTQFTGRVGNGNASIALAHSYGNMMLSLSTVAPSIFDGITNAISGAPLLSTSSANRRAANSCAAAAQPSRTGTGAVYGATQDVRRPTTPLVELLHLLPAMSDSLASLTAASHA